MNLTLAKAAIAGVTDPSKETAKGYCDRFVRQVTEDVYGNKYEQYFGPFEPSALLTMRAFARDGIAMTASQAGPLQVGDIVLKGTDAGPAGHVAVYVGPIILDDGEHIPDALAENSSTSKGRVQGAKGYRSKEQFGRYDMVVRLPDPKPAAPVVVKPDLPTIKRFRDGRQVGATVRGKDLVDYDTPGRLKVAPRAFPMLFGITLNFVEDTQTLELHDILPKTGT